MAGPSAAVGSIALIGDSVFDNLAYVAGGLDVLPHLRPRLHAPNRMMPQPNLVPVRPMTSPSTQSSGISPGTLMGCAWPLTIRTGSVLSS